MHEPANEPVHEPVSLAHEPARRVADSGAEAQEALGGVHKGRRWAVENGHDGRDQLGGRFKRAPVTRPSFARRATESERCPTQPMRSAGRSRDCSLNRAASEGCKAAMALRRADAGNRETRMKLDISAQEVEQWNGDFMSTAACVVVSIMSGWKPTR